VLCGLYVLKETSRYKAKNANFKKKSMTPPTHALLPHRKSANFIRDIPQIITNQQFFMINLQSQIRKFFAVPVR
jgi:hypothetical protein